MWVIQWWFSERKAVVGEKRGKKVVMSAKRGRSGKPEGTFKYSASTDGNLEFGTGFLVWRTLRIDCGCSRLKTDDQTRYHLPI